MLWVFSLSVDKIIQKLVDGFLDEILGVRGMHDEQQMIRFWR